VSLYYEDEFVELHLGDCRAVQAWTTADVLVTDPPYGIGWSKGAMKSARNSVANPGIRNDHDTSARDAALEVWGHTKPALVFGSLRAQYPTGWNKMLIFQKAQLSGMWGNWSPWRSDWEPIFVLGEWPKQKPLTSSVFRTSEISAGGYNGYATKTGHPHTKPQDVMTRLLETCPPGVIADPFAGSGATLLAARNLGRKAIGVELEEKYCELIVKRLSQQAFDFSSL
jgi:site-specific DNA-methyltransferase (adenine-specific)